MEHILATSHLGILQQLVEELIKARDPDATFVQEKPEPAPEPVALDGFGRPVDH
jgi:hypothetical protein